MDIYQNGSYASISALFGGGNQNAGHGFMESMQRFTNVAHLADKTKAKLMDMTKDYNFGAFARKIKAATNQMNKVFDYDNIKVMRTVKEIQVAKPRMQRAISANPTLKRLILNGTCEGYTDYEFDNKHIGVFDHNYQSIRNGVLCKDEGMNGEERYGMTTYQNSGGLANLSIYEKHALNITYRHLEKSIDEDLSDPTSKWDELMK
jgi:hypothetical protein